LKKSLIGFFKINNFSIYYFLAGEVRGDVVATGVVGGEGV
jgi:hypothetical protein